MVSLNKVTTVHLMKELEKRERNVAKLETRYTELSRQLREVESELAVMGKASGRPGRRTSATRGGRKGVRGGPRRRARNEVSLPDAVAQAMEVRAVVSPSEAAQLVKKNGYKTNAKNFNMMVSNALAKDKRFKRLSRGQYERVS